MKGGRPWICDVVREQSLFGWAHTRLRRRNRKTAGHPSSPGPVAARPRTARGSRRACPTSGHACSSSATRRTRPPCRSTPSRGSRRPTTRASTNSRACARPAPTSSRASSASPSGRRATTTRAGRRRPGIATSSRSTRGSSRRRGSPSSSTAAASSAAGRGGPPRRSPTQPPARRRAAADTTRVSWAPPIIPLRRLRIRRRGTKEGCSGLRRHRPRALGRAPASSSRSHTPSRRRREERLHLRWERGPRPRSNSRQSPQSHPRSPRRQRRRRRRRHGGNTAHESRLIVFSPPETGPPSTRILSTTKIQFPDAFRETSLGYNVSQLVLMNKICIL
mmetsp:Transcript_27361/g.109560  ORF Transcript_27361/g.109560 Transcript_27361/m.109560 type:complete len:334 (+) Transcript_27361:549-1550(+)